ncbi:hypothetical protein Nmel_005783 [Mimus melanotis]
MEEPDSKLEMVQTPAQGIHLGRLELSSIKYLPSKTITPTGNMSPDIEFPASSDVWLWVHTVQQHNIRYHYSVVVNYNKLGYSFGNRDQQAGAQQLHATQPHPIHLSQARINPRKGWNN